MNFHLLIDTPSIFRLAIALVLSGGVLLLLARFIFGSFPRGRD
jgi:hypothetical protein